MNIFVCDFIWVYKIGFFIFNVNENISNFFFYNIKLFYLKVLVESWLGSDAIIVNTLLENDTFFFTSNNTNYINVLKKRRLESVFQKNSLEFLWNTSVYNWLVLRFDGFFVYTIPLDVKNYFFVEMSTFTKKSSERVLIYDYIVSLDPNVRGILYIYYELCFFYKYANMYPTDFNLQHFYVDLLIRFYKYSSGYFKSTRL